MTTLNIKSLNIFCYHSKTWIFSLVLVTLISIFYILLERKNHGINMVDFEVFYRTAERMADGQNLYRIESDGDYVFKYAPASALYFLPFLALPLNVAKIIFWLILSICVFYVYYLSGRLFLKPHIRYWPRDANSIIFVAFAAIFIHLERELVLGQVNWLLLCLYLLMITAYSRDKQILTGLILAFTLFIKPFGLIFLPYFILKRRYKTIGWFILFFLVLFLLPLIFYSFPEYVAQLRGWVHELSIEMGNKQDLHSQRIHTIFSILVRYTPLYFISFGPAIKLVYQVIVLSLLALAVLWFIRMGRKKRSSENESLALLIALIPLIAFTNDNAFLFLTPGIVFTLSRFDRLGMFEKFFLCAGLLFQGANIHDLWGAELSLKIQDWSLVAIGAVMIILVMFLMKSKPRVFPVSRS